VTTSASFAIFGATVVAIFRLDALHDLTPEKGDAFNVENAEAVARPSPVTTVLNHFIR